MIGQAGTDDGLARGVLARARLQHLAQDHLADLLAAQPGALEQVGDHRGAELGGGGLGKGSAKLADRGAGGSNDNDVFHGVSFKRSGRFDQQDCDPFWPAR